MIIVLLWWLLPFVAITYLLNPLLVYFRVKMTANPPIQPFDPLISPDPPVIKDFLAASRSNLEQLGFRFIGYFLPQVNEKSRMYIGLFKNFDTLEHAMTSVSFYKIGSEFQLRKNMVEFTTKYEGDFEIDTSSNKDPGIFGEMKDRRIERLPKAKNSQEVYRVHRYVQTLYPQLKKVDRHVETDSAEYLRQVFIKGFARQVPRGYLKLDPKAGSFRPTLLGFFP